jgi:DNA polymerase-3 subunit delta'
VPFSNIVGQTGPIELLGRAVRADAVPQSLLFAGPEGVGKKQTALALAQVLNCAHRSPSGDACGTCTVCRRIVAGTFPDVVLLDKGEEASIKIDSLRRRVLDLVGYRPFEGRRRVFIIDPADELTVQAQEALLKTLEEPPPATVLILVTAFADTLLATIRSRCRRIRFAPLSTEDLVAVLTRGSARIDVADARHRALVAGGSVSRAMAADGREFVGDRQAALQLLQALQGRPLVPRLKAAAAFSQVDGKKRKARDAAYARLAILGSLLRDLIALQVRAESPIANSDLEADLVRLQSTLPADRIAVAFGLVQQAEQSIERNASPKIVADWLAVHL